MHFVIVLLRVCSPAQTQVHWIWRFIENSWEFILSRRSCCFRGSWNLKLISVIAPAALNRKEEFPPVFFFFLLCLHNNTEQLICELVKDDGKTRWPCCFQSGAVSMALCAFLSPLRRYTVGLSAFPLSGPPSLPKPSYSPLFLCLVFCLRPSLIRCAGSNFPIYKHLKYLPLRLPLARFLKNIQQPNATVDIANCPTYLQAVSVCSHHISPSSLYSLHIPRSLPASTPVYWPFLMHCGRFVWR